MFVSLKRRQGQALELEIRRKRGGRSSHLLITAPSDHFRPNNLTSYNFYNVHIRPFYSKSCFEFHPNLLTIQTTLLPSFFRPPFQTGTPVGALELLAIGRRSQTPASCSTSLSYSSSHPDVPLESISVDQSNPA
jgi:hypothetical protein